MPTNDGEQLDLHLHETNYNPWWQKWIETSPIFDVVYLVNFMNKNLAFWSILGMIGKKTPPINLVIF